MIPGCDATAELQVYGKDAYVADGNDGLQARSGAGQASILSQTAWKKSRDQTALASG